MKRLTLVLLALAMALSSFALAACGDDDDEGGGGGEDVSDASFDLQVGALVPLTGDLSQFGPPGEKAAELAIEEASAALEEATGGNITVTMDSADTQTEPNAAQQAATQLISGGASCLVGPWASGETVPVGRSVAARDEVPLISPSSTSPEITELPDNGFVFRTAPSDAIQGQVLADQIEAQVGTDAVVSVGARNDPYGEGIATAFTEAWEALGGQTTGEPVLYDLDLSSYNSEAGDIVANDPDLYVIVDFEDPYNKVGAALARSGNFDPANLWVTDGLAFEDGIPDSIPADAIAGSSGTRPSGPEEVSPAAEAFDKLYKSSPGEKARGTFDAQNFDAATLCVLGAVAAGSSEGPDIAEQIQAVASPPGDKYDYTTMGDAIAALQAGDDIDFEGVSGPLDLDDNGDPTIGYYDVFEYDDQGKFSVVDKVEQASEEG